MNHPAIHIVILALCLLILAGSCVLSPDGVQIRIGETKWQWRCLLYRYTGIRCALCGLTRSFTALGHGRLREAFAQHPIGPLLFGFVIVQIPYRIWAIQRCPQRLPARARRLHAIVAAGIAAAILANWLVYLGGFL